MKDRTKTQDATPMPSAAVLKEVAAGPLFAKLTGSAAMSGANTLGAAPSSMCCHRNLRYSHLLLDVMWL